MLRQTSTYAGALLLGGLLVLLRYHSAAAEPAPATVEGVITYQGEPVSNAFVTFKCRGMSESLYGQTDKQGRYELYSRMEHELPIGKYAVTIVKRTTQEDRANRKGGCRNSRRRNRHSHRVVDLLPEHYGDGPTSGLIAVIEPGDNVFDFMLSDVAPKSNASDVASGRTAKLSLN
ncbi:carboxypeptidase-like regulatory domain-containing protein [Blastopirellula sp. J2-11]|uniref:carboxypeptidase-like regulatory domain-containing protein n=1 Tax=Blastopirellula sp. J2-11 TaxID=2943192 RepID=UPI0021C8B270|nr:carboxypeptidase-like regulatory domain-containing protein [Blastopirellula sp. J2-11]UUO04961.1 carboxypeptidase-like regulatory domain-containing protein [Blastopirellula sp. J2-11]